MLEAATVPEKIVERKTIVFKSRLDLKAIRLTAEKMKTKLFTRLMFLKRKAHMYKLTFQNIKTGEEAPVIIDAVTGRTHKELT